MSTAREATVLRGLVDQHYEMLYRFAYRLCGLSDEAEDLTQETFCTAQQKIGQLRDTASARAWLCQILRNLYLQSRRGARGLPNLSLEHLTSEPAQPEDEEFTLDAKQLQEMLAELPESYRSVIILYYLNDLTYRQIAQQMRIPIGTVMSRLARGRNFLRCRWRSNAPVSSRTPAAPGVS